MPKGIIRVHPMTAKRAGEILRAVLNRSPTQVTEPTSDPVRHRCRFTADFDDGRRDYVFEA